MKHSPVKSRAKRAAKAGKPATIAALTTALKDALDNMNWTESGGPEHAAYDRGMAVWRAALSSSPVGSQVPDVAALIERAREVVAEADQMGGRERTVSRYAIDRLRAVLPA